MYCRNCGKEINENAAVCIHCGVKNGEGRSFCPNCGATTNESAVVCVKCGFGLKKSGSGTGVTGEKSKILAIVFAVLLGHLGVHQFYLGYKQNGIIKIVCSVISGFLVLFGIGIIGFFAIFVWNVIDAVMIGTGKLKDSDGNDLASS